MKIFGLILGCPEAALHCKHFHDKRTREIPREPFRGCNVARSPLRIRERRDKCCNCGWVSKWYQIPH